MNLIDYPIVLMKPTYRSGFVDWVGHIPFAGWIMQAMKPKQFVELGVLYGDSYMAFCQAATQASPATKCIGIDLWAPTFDFVNMDVNETKVQRFFAEHERYAHFSQLVQTTFDKALDTFPDGSIDLLHIDGNHLEVQHDYDTWRRKLSSSGVILFHDILLDAINSKVPAFWKEAKLRHPWFEFTNGTGLGLLAVGEFMPDPIADLVSTSGTETGKNIQKWFAILGNQLQFLIRRGYYDEPSLNDPVRR